jgi:hypothetical protein
MYLSVKNITDILEAFDHLDNDQDLTESQIYIRQYLKDILELMLVKD